MIGYVRRVRRAVKEEGIYRFGPWGSFWRRFSIQGWRWLKLGVFKFDDKWALNAGPLWVELGPPRTPPKDDVLDSWGFSTDGDSRCVHLRWGHRSKILHYPWALEWARTEHGMPDGSFRVAEQAGRFPAWVSGYHRLATDAAGDLTPALPWKPGTPYVARGETPGRYEETFPFRYTLKSGEVQERTATVTVERMTWTWRAAYRLGLFPRVRVRTSIDVKFDGEVGERTGSWKGGTIGCGYDLRPGESPEQCLRRMERERAFS